MRHAQKLTVQYARQLLEALQAGGHQPETDSVAWQLSIDIMAQNVAQDTCDLLRQVFPGEYKHALNQQRLGRDTSEGLI